MNSTPNTKKRLVATDKKYHEAPVFIAPKENPQTRKVIDYIGRLPESMRDKVTISLEPKRDRDDNVTDEMVVRVNHLMVFDLANPNDALLFEVIKDDDMIAPSKEAVNPQFHRFYIEDKEKEATALISKSKLKAKAFAVLAELSTEQMENYARVLGKFMRGLSSTQIESALYDVCEKTPQLFLDVDNDKDLKYKIFIRRCVEGNILHMDNGKFMNGKDLVGINEAYAILWMKDPANSALITQWNQLLEKGISQQPQIDAFITPGAEPEAKTHGIHDENMIHQGENSAAVASSDATETETVNAGAEGNTGDPGASDPNLNDQPTE